MFALAFSREKTGACLRSDGVETGLWCHLASETFISGIHLCVSSGDAAPIDCDGALDQQIPLILLPTDTSKRTGN